MKQYFLFTALVIVSGLVACNQAVKETASTKIIGMDSVAMPVDTAQTELMKVSELSANELKDDSVFSDGSTPASWKNAGITDVKGVKLFIKQLQQWVIMNDKEKLAEVVQYPLNKAIKTKAALINNYDMVFTKEVKLSFATVNFNQVFRNANGVMTDGGKVWIAQQGKGFKVTAINYTVDGKK